MYRHGREISFVCIRKALGVIVFASVVLRILRHIRRTEVRLYFDARSSVVGRILPSLVTLHKGYSPPPLIPSGVLQSVAGLAGSQRGLPYCRETFQLGELRVPQDTGVLRTCCPAVAPAGVVSLDWLEPLQEDEATPVCVVVAGLTGSSQDSYVCRTAVALRESGMRVACYNARGRGGNSVSTPFLYCAGYTEDLRRVLSSVHGQYPRAPMVAVGFSLGSNILAKYVGEEGVSCVLAAAVSIACPVDLLLSSNSLTSTWAGKVLSRALVSNLHKMRGEMSHLFEDDAIHAQRARDASDIREFDDCITAPMFGFRCVSDYYRDASSGNYLRHVRIPMLFLSARNDPVSPADAVGKDNFQGGASVGKAGLEALPLLLAVTDEGGHSMLWPEGVFSLRPWAHLAITEFLVAVLRDCDGTCRSTTSVG